MLVFEVMDVFNVCCAGVPELLPNKTNTLKIV
jgi:hypothetical protein